MPFFSAQFRRIDLAGCVIAGCIIAASYSIGLRPLFGAMADRADLSHGVQELKRQNRQSQGNVHRLARDIASLDEQLAGTQRLLDRTQVNHTISLVTEQALKEGLIVESSTADEPENSEMYAVVPIHISGKGEFSATARFIRALTEDHTDIEVRSFTLNSDATRNGGGSDFRIELAWYVLPD